MVVLWYKMGEEVVQYQPPSNPLTKQRHLTVMLATVRQSINITA